MSIGIMPNQMETSTFPGVNLLDNELVATRFGLIIAGAIHQLLASKHIYQSLTVDRALLDASGLAHHAKAAETGAELSSRVHRRSTPAVETFKVMVNQMHLDRAWFPASVKPLIETGMDILQSNAKEAYGKFPAPTIKIACDKCGDREPFNPTGALVELTPQAPATQWFYFRYECQGCKVQQVRFLVRRSGLKLTLAGREPFETIEVPSYIPKETAANLRNALIADHGGQPLAAIFLLRVFVEQYWKSLPAVSSKLRTKIRPTGEELGAAYSATLPKDFRDRFPSLTGIYDQLSAAMHDARGDAVLFSKCRDGIFHHFDARRLYELDQAPPPGRKGGSRRRAAA